MDKQVLTHSRLACFRDCPRKHYLRYELGLSAEDKSLALRVGTAFHAALEAIASGADPEPIIDSQLADDYDAAMVAAMVTGHARRYAGQTLEVVAAECEFNLPLRNPDSGSPSLVWTKAGKVDRIVRLADGRLALMEYKTTSQDFAPGADYWLRLHMDSQLSMYVIAARELGHEIDTVLYDVTRRPGLRPLKATPEAARKYTNKDGRLYANQRENDETPEEFAGRVAADIEARPDHYFARIEIARLDQDLNDCAHEVWQQQLAIRNAQRSGHWYRNPASCINPYPCEYLPVCQNRDLATRTPQGYRRNADVHPELAGNATLEG